MASKDTYRYLAYRKRRRNANHKGAPRWLMALALLGGIAAVSVGVIAGIGYAVYRSYASDLIPPDEAIAKLPVGGARILDRNGKPLYEFLDDNSGLRDPVSTEEISRWVPYATIATEDSSFMTNPGVNYKGLASAAFQNFSPFGSSPGFLEGRGGSSITQQLVKNVYFSPEERTKRSVDRKIRETVYALELTKKYSKAQILTWYLNEISYGNVFVGIEAASMGYFGVHAKDLSLAQAALLAGVPSCPSCYDPINEPAAAQDQRNYVLKRMYDEGYISGEQFWTAAAEPLNVKLRQFDIEAPHFVFDIVQPELERIFGEEAIHQDGLVVYTSLDLDAQHKAQDILESYIEQYEGTAGGHNGAGVGIDPKTGQIIVYIGSRDFFNEDIHGQNDMALALNSPGSSFKPFTYITAFMKLGWGPGTTILDTPVSSKWWDGKNPPRNPVAHSGPITVRNALGNSLNIPAVKTILSVGVPEVVKQAKKMGITSLDGRDLGPSMTVGGVDVKLLDMVYGYTAFPNLGVLKGVESTVARPEGNRTVDPVSILRVEDREGNILYPKVDDQPVDSPPIIEERVAPAPEAYLIDNILSDPSATCLTYGCGGLNIPGHPMGAKTGTSEPYETIGLIGETWTYGFTPQMVFGTWFGNADNTPMQNITSYYVSANTTRDFMIAYHENLPVEEFARPDGVASASECIPSGLKPTPNCPQTTPNDLFAASSLPSKDDDWWQLGKIDTRTGRPATPSTPARFVEEQHFLHVPDGVPEFIREQALEWVNEFKAKPGEVPTPQAPGAEFALAITSPGDGSPVSGITSINGSASSADFQSYRLEFRSESSPGDWLLITHSTSPIVGGVLGHWNTFALQPGLYAVRLVLVDSRVGETSTQIVLLVTVPPAATPTAPATG
jgi:membrane peptidoglycan carboxypeptidase